MGKPTRSIISMGKYRQTHEEAIVRKERGVFRRANDWLRKKFGGGVTGGPRIAAEGQPYGREVQFQGGRSKYGIPKVPEGKGREPARKNAASESKEGVMLLPHDHGGGRNGRAGNSGAVSGRKGPQERLEKPMERQRKP